MNQGTTQTRRNRLAPPLADPDSYQFKPIITNQALTPFFKAASCVRRILELGSNKS